MSGAEPTEDEAATDERPGGPASARRRGGLWLYRAVAITTALALVCGGAGWLYLSREAVLNHGPPPVGDGPTYRQALSAVEGALGSVPGGAWVLFGAYGIATPLAFQPASLGWGGTPNATHWCRLALPGLTIWNGTIPRFHGSYLSGTAPFWEFLFFSNTSQQIASGSDVNQVVGVDPPIAMTSPCGLAIADGSPLWGWADYDLTPFTLDSPQVAQAAWLRGAGAWVATNPSSAEMYVFGDTEWPLWPAGMDLTFQSCGLAGVGGTQPYFTTFVDSGGGFSVEAGQVTCTPAEGLSGPPIPFVAEFTNESVTSRDSSQYVSADLSTAEGFGPDPTTYSYGLVAWMTQLELFDPQGQPVASAPAVCSTWVLSLSGCTANVSGWYVVVFTQNGHWLDSYPSGTNSTGWNDPAGALDSDEVLSVVVPGSWNVTGDDLEVNATTSIVPVSGSLVAE